jgi:hypothetical protein
MEDGCMPVRIKIRAGSQSSHQGNNAVRISIEKGNKPVTCSADIEGVLSPDRVRTRW